MEDNSVKERTIKFISYKGLKMKEFEAMANLSTGYVTSMRKSFGEEKLKNVLTAFPELNRDWLLYGEGSMLKEIHKDESNVTKKKERTIDRFSKYMKAKGLNDNKVTVEVDLSVGTLGKSRKENRDLSAKNIEKILNYYQDLNKVWLLTGEGSMLKETAQADNNATFVAPYITDELVYLPLITTSAVASFDENLHHATNEIDTYPVYVAKGETFDINKHVVIDVSGDSMYPTINDKAKVLCEKVKPEQWANIPNEKVVAVIYGSSFIIKRLLKNNLAINNSLTLLADNRKYGETTLQRCEIRAIFRVIKKVSEEVF